MSLTLRSATPADAGLILRFVRALAVYEKLEQEAKATEASLAQALTGQTKRISCEIAELNGAPVGFALWFYIYSTFNGRFSLFLEDLFVEPEARGRGVGKALLARLARRCVDEDLGRMDWAVLDARLTTEWTGVRLTGEALAALAASE